MRWEPEPSGWRWDTEEESAEEELLGMHFRVKQKPGLGESPRSLCGRPQLTLLAIVDKKPELAIPSDQIGGCPDCHPATDGGRYREPQSNIRWS